MAIEMKIPSVGESITEVTISSWLKKDGDFVERDEIIVELETDKATQEFPAEASGILSIKVAEGETVAIGTLVATIEPQVAASTIPKADLAPVVSAVPTSAPKSTGVIKDMIVPQVGESITEVVLSNWLIADGGFVNLDQEIAELESDKATFEFPAEAKGILRHVAKEGDTVPIGGVIARIEVMEGDAPVVKSDVPSASPSTPNPMPVGNDSYAAGHPSPVAAKS